MKRRGILFLVLSMLGTAAMMPMTASAASPKGTGESGFTVSVHSACPGDSDQNEASNCSDGTQNCPTDGQSCLAGTFSCPTTVLINPISAAVHNVCTSNCPIVRPSCLAGTSNCQVKIPENVKNTILAIMEGKYSNCNQGTVGTTKCGIGSKGTTSCQQPTEEQTKPVEPETTVNPAESIIPVEPTESVTEPTTPVSPTESVTEPTTPVSPTEPVTESTAPVKPTEPVIEPTVPVNPTQPVTEPTTPVNTGSIKEDLKLTVAGTTYYIGQSVSELGTPAEQLTSAYGFTWYVYGTGTYTDFFAAGIADGKVVALTATGSGFTYQGMKSGSQKGNYDQSDCLVTIATDKNDNNIVHGVFIRDKQYGTVNLRSKTYTSTMLADESKMNFHMTNGFRVYHGLNALNWSDQAARAAQLHSQDMADQNYFAHNSLDGRTPWARMAAQGVNYRSAGENIDCGYFTAFNAYDGWVNSAGHRSNMLGTSFTYLGVGGGYRAGNSYRVFFTQDFYS